MLFSFKKIKGLIIQDLVKEGKEKVGKYALSRRFSTIHG
jgi:hypothetical protein